MPPIIEIIVDAAEAKKARDICALDLHEIANFTDYFVICDASSDRQVKAISENIFDSLKKAGYRVLHREGEQEGLWILLDCGSVVVHVFRTDRRKFYDLDRLWSDGPAVIERHEPPEASDEDQYVDLPWRP